MIIICNNCKTKFKVLDSLIPPEGRMVQCSYCNAKWKQDNISEVSSNVGLWIFWIITLSITLSILYVGIIIDNLINIKMLFFQVIYLEANNKELQ